MVSVIVVTYNSEKCIFKCLQSLKGALKDSDEVIVVDNSNKDYGIPGVIVNPSGSYPSGLNAGIRIATQPILVCTNPDVTFKSDSIVNMVRGLEFGYSVVGPMTDMASGIQGFKLALPHQAMAIDARFLIGFCFALPRTAYDAIGPFDERFVYEQDDLDYSLRARQAGMKLGIVPHSFVQHEGNASAVTNPKILDMRFESFFKMFEKYPDMDFIQTLGSGWPYQWFIEVSNRYPQVKQIKSFQLALTQHEGK